MKQNVLKQAADYLKKRRKKALRRRLLSILACVVVFCTTYSLIMPAITLETDVMTSNPTETSATTENNDNGGTDDGSEANSSSSSGEEPDKAPGGETSGTPTDGDTDSSGDGTEDGKTEDGDDAKTEDGDKTDGTETGDKTEGSDTGDKTEGTETEDANKPTEGEDTGDVNKPTEGEDGDDTNKPTEGEDTGDVNKPTEGEDGDDTNKPTEGEEGGDANNPTEGEDGDDTNKPAEGEGTDDVNKPAEGDGTENPVDPENPEEQPPEEEDKGLIEGIIDGILDILLPEEIPLEELPEEYDEYALATKTTQLDGNDGSVSAEFIPAEAFPGINPNSLVLYATQMGEASGAYLTAQGTLEENGMVLGEDYDGMEVLDIYFMMVDEDGEETPIEPAGPVTVRISAYDILPEDADPDSVSIQHHVDPSSSAYRPVVYQAKRARAAMMSDTSESSIVLETISSNDIFVSDTDVSAEFEVTSFSYFTITYKRNQWDTNPQQLNVYLVDEYKNDIGPHNIPINTNKDVAFGSEIDILAVLRESNVDLATYAYNGKVYTYAGVYADASCKTAIDKVKYDTIRVGSGWGWVEKTGWWYKTSYGDWTELSNVYVKYQEVTEADAQKAYFYVIKPDQGVFGVNAQNTPIGNWYYFGSGSLLKEACPGNGRNYLYDADQVLNEPDYPDSIQVKVDGKLKTYWYEGLLDGKSPEEQLTFRDEKENMFYNVEWVRFVDTYTSYHPGKSSAEQDGGNSYLNLNDPYKETDVGYAKVHANNGQPIDGWHMFETDKSGQHNEMRVWHIDGYLVLRPKIQVSYYVLDENGAAAQLPDVRRTDGFYAGSMLNKGDSADAAKRYYCDTDTGLYGENGVVEFDDWYLDEACEHRYNGEPLNEDTKLYHKLTIKRPSGYNLTVGKVSSEVEIEDEATPLAAFPGLDGATFNIYEGNGTTSLVTLSPRKQGGVEGMATASTYEAGNVLLEFDKVYRLEETVAPGGYNRLAAPIYFKATLGEKDKDGKFPITLSLCDVNGNIGDTYKQAQVPENGLTLIVANVGGYVLPETGGSGTWAYSFGGCLLMLSAGLALASMRSMRTARRKVS